jgi:hypothetical protein
LLAEVRKDFRRKVLAHKESRRVALSPHLTLYFEDRLTVQYQVQEMLRIERIFEAAGIDEELAAYNPLVPDGSNLKATFMIEYADVDERKRELARLIGIEDAVWVRAPEQFLTRIDPDTNEVVEVIAPVRWGLGAYAPDDLDDEHRVHPTTTRRSLWLMA